MVKNNLALVKNCSQFLLFLTVFMLSMHINRPDITSKPVLDQPSSYTEQSINLLPFLPETTENPTSGISWILIQWHTSVKPTFNTPYIINKGHVLFKTPFDWNIIHTGKHIFNCIFRIQNHLNFPAFKPFFKNIRCFILKFTNMSTEKSVGKGMSGFKPFLIVFGLLTAIIILAKIVMTLLGI